jgi:hypothetical protein
LRESFVFKIDFCCGKKEQINRKDGFG